MIGHDAKPLPVDPDSDTALINRSREGDVEAFNELVVRHRMKAYSWASHISKDPHMADDIVQDALIRAFLHLGTLMDNARFLPWLKVIVRNQALMRMRRGGPYRYEQPFSSLQVPEIGRQHVDVRNLDNVLSYLTRSTGNAASEDDPSIAVERRELLVTIRSLLQCLTPRERKVFEAHFFNECSPQEIAELLQTTTGNIYKVISRSKIKIQQERLSMYIRAHIQQRKDESRFNRNMLDKDLLMNTREPLHLTYINRIHEALQLCDPALTLSSVYGALTFAFNLNIEQERIDMSSTNMVDRNYIYLNGLLNLGLSSRYVEAFNFSPPDPVLLTESIKLAQQSIDNGYPCMVWELIHSEFGLIYGYDDDVRLFFGFDSTSIAEIPYQQLTGARTKALFVLGIEHKANIDLAAVLLRTCKMAIRHARGGEATFAGYVNGLAAYRTWMDALRRRNVEPTGHAYTIAVLSQARRHAAQFLDEMTCRWGEDQTADHKILNLLKESADCYRKVSGVFHALEQLFPIPSGGEPDDPETSSRAIACLKQAEQAEEAGIQALEEIVSRIEETYTHLQIVPIIESPPRAYHLSS